MKIIEDYNRICLYCGNEIEPELDYGERTHYYECDCPDATKKRDIKSKIRELELQIPEEKYSIVEKSVLFKNQ